MTHDRVESIGLETPRHARRLEKKSDSTMLMIGTFICSVSLMFTVAQEKILNRLRRCHE